MREKHQCAWRLSLLGGALIALAVPAAWAQNPNPPAPSQAKPVAEPSLTPNVPPNKVVMKVGDKQITAGEFETLMKTLPPQVQRAAMTQGLKDVGDQYAKLVAIAEKATADGIDQRPDVKTKIELQRMQLLAQGEYAKINEDIKVTPDDVSQYYKDHMKDFEQVEIRQVSIRKKASNAKADAPGLPEADAKAKAEAMRAALASGEEATKVRDQFKMDNVVFFDPTPRPVRHGQLAGPMDQAAWSLKDGEVSEIQNNPINFYFLQVVKHDTPPLTDLSKEIEGKLKEEKSQAALNSVESGAKIWMDPTYFAAGKHEQEGENEKPAAPKANAAAPQTQQSSNAKP
ncbi:MAG TPA: peptidylprolyl isomerase [Terriglobia bacterium]|nr:peptidylprolyl isomerase [Terriglobia bacterium]